MGQVLLPDIQGSDQNVATGEPLRHRLFPGSTVRRSTSLDCPSVNIVDLDHFINDVCFASISMAHQILVLYQDGKYARILEYDQGRPSHRGMKQKSSW